MEAVGGLPEARVVLLFVVVVETAAITAAVGDQGVYMGTTTMFALATPYKQSAEIVLVEMDQVGQFA